MHPIRLCLNMEAEDEELGGSWRTSKYPSAKIDPDNGAIRILIAIAGILMIMRFWQWMLKLPSYGRLSEHHMEQPEGINHDACMCIEPDVAFAQNLYRRKSNTELDVTGFCKRPGTANKDIQSLRRGYVMLFNGGAVDWKSKKQTTIAMHATQSEYMAAQKLQ
ncbi:hypothetical protein Tco_1256035 [Tanacetum coccineum]